MTALDKVGIEPRVRKFLGRSELLSKIKLLEFQLSTGECEQWFLTFYNSGFKNKSSTSSCGLFLLGYPVIGSLKSYKNTI